MSNEHVERLQGDLDQLRVAALLAYGDEHFESKLEDATAMVHGAIHQHRMAATRYLTRKAVTANFEVEAARFQEAAKRRNVATPLAFTRLESAVDDQSFLEQLDNLRALLAVAVRSPDPNAAGIRRLVGTLVKVERQLREIRLVTGEYMQPAVAEAAADRFAEEIRVWGRDSMPYDVWEAIIDEVVGEPAVPA